MPDDDLAGFGTHCACEHDEHDLGNGVYELKWLG